jgi:hypothetical protein
MKSFSKWTIEEVEETFHLILQKHHEQLNAWMTPQISPSETEKQQLMQLSEKLLDHVWDWNEEELKVYVIIPLLNLVNFEQENAQPFLSRELSMTYQDEKITSIVDFVVANGKRSPKRPFFFIHEYKKEHDSSDDPLGQLMIAMVTAFKLNNDGHPIYGAYIMGRYWHFVVLDENSYAVHTGLNATNEDRITIWNVLKNTTQIIKEWDIGRNNSL